MAGLFADSRSMVARLTAVVPRFVLLPALALFATATLTFAANTQISPSQPAPAAAPAAPAVLLVPDVRLQAYVFAKGTLEDAGFAWRVAGSVQGYAANQVASQNPSPGTRVLDTGAPTVVLTLRRNPKFPEKGVPENTAPFRGTEIAIAGVTTQAPKPQAKPKPVKKAVAPKPAKVAKTKAAPAAKTKPAKKTSAAAQARPAAFVVPGAPKEPLDEMPLPARAAALDKWVAAHPTKTPAAVRHWLYQHAWIVSGARFGWWHGAEALERLIQVDRRVQRQWGLGAKSEQLARATLAEVRAKSK